MHKKRFGVICSGGGSAFEEMYKILIKSKWGVEAVAVTDRKCKSERVFQRHKIPFIRIEDKSRQRFSQEAARWLFKIKKTKCVVLLFERIISKELFSIGPVLNIHPSLLPAFKGFGALKKAHQANVQYFGATAHFADENVDSGPILAQAISPKNNLSLKKMKKISFAQKVYLLLVVIETFFPKKEKQKNIQKKDKKTCISQSFCNPPLKNKYLEKNYRDFLKTNKIKNLF